MADTPADPADPADPAGNPNKLPRDVNDLIAYLGNKLEELGAMTSTDHSDPTQCDDWLRLRVWINGELADEGHAHVFEPDANAKFEAIRARHEQLVTDAMDADPDTVWLVEVYDPDEPEREAYTRIGTDAAGMIDPQPVGDPGRFSDDVEMAEMADGGLRQDRGTAMGPRE